MEWDCHVIPQVLTLWAFWYLPLSPEITTIIIGTGFMLVLFWGSGIARAYSLNLKGNVFLLSWNPMSYQIKAFYSCFKSFISLISLQTDGFFFFFLMNAFFKFHCFSILSYLMVCCVFFLFFFCRLLL